MTDIFRPHLGLTPCQLPRRCFLCQGFHLPNALLQLSLSGLGQADFLNWDNFKLI
jgi:hypothetical protein